MTKAKAKGIEVAQAYVTIIPSMKDSQKTIAKELGAEAESAGKDAGNKAGEGLSEGLSAKAVVIGNVITDVLRSAVSKAVDVGREIVSGVYEGFSANEQLVGGMQKLFGDSASTVIENANAAFMTAGKSANEYMEGVTSIAASLVSSLGGDTEEAARLADVAMRAMSDNINTFGTDAEMVQNAITGLAKGNYSMLDNLSLGFAGNQQGMVDLINASGVLGRELTNTSELADVGLGTMIEAIQRVQEDMGIAGTTAKEAMGTLEGSANAARSAWQNVLTSIGTGDPEQVKAATAGLMDAVFGTVDDETGRREGGLIQNVLGLARRSFEALGQALPGMVSSALDAMPNEVGGPLRELFDSMAEAARIVDPIVTGVMSAIASAIGPVMSVVGPMLPVIVGVVAAVKAAAVITSIVGAISGAVGVLTGVVIPAIGAISSVPSLIAAVVAVLGGPVTAIAAVVGAIVAFVATNEDARTAILNAFNAIKEGISKALNSVKSFVITVANAIVAGAVGKFQALVGTVQGIFNRVKTAIMTPINAAKNAVQSAISRISSIIRGVKLQLPHINLPHFSVSGGKAPWGIAGKGSPPSFSVKWYARSGYFDNPTLLAGVGERGGEFVWPSYAPYLDQYAEAIARRMPGSGGQVVNVYLDGMRVNDDDAIRRDVLNLVSDLSRYNRALTAARG